jgi:hypothetical protein
VNLRVSECCGTCIHVNSPNIPEDHAAHYMVAKSERWCSKNNIPTMKEAVCDNYELNTKGASRKFGRIKKQNERLQKIIEIKEYMMSNRIDKIESHNKKFYIQNDRVVYEFTTYDWSSVYYVSIKEVDPFNQLVEAYKNLRK